jgi:hypothetical protein
MSPLLVRTPAPARSPARAIDAQAYSGGVVGAARILPAVHLIKDETFRDEGRARSWYPFGTDC